MPGPLNDIATFVRVAELGSFTAAARELDIPKSTVSRRVRRLESHLGVELLHRSPRSFRLTEHGELMRTRASPALRELADLERVVTELDDSPRGVLRLAAPADFGGAPTFGRWLAAFRGAYPDIRLEVDLANRLVDVIAEGFDVALRAHTKPLADSSSLMSKRIARLGGRLFAAPKYIAENGRPRSIRDLARHDCVVMTQMGTTWTLARSRDSEPTQIEVDAAITANSFTLVASAVTEGAGIGMLPGFHAASLVDDGALVPVLPSWKFDAGGMSLVWPATRHLSPRVRAFIDFAADAASELGD